MGHLYTDDLLPSSVADAIRVFDERYLAGLSAAEPTDWVSQLGDEIPLDSPLVRFPIGLLASKYHETREESGRFRTMGDEYFDLRVTEFDDGHEVKLIDLLTNPYTYRKWQQVPNLFLSAERKLVNVSMAALLEDTNQLSPWDGLAFFHAAHKATPTVGGVTTTWGNLQTTPKDVTDLSKITEELALMSNVRDENGDRIDIRADTILVPPEKADALEVRLAQALVLAAPGDTVASNNPYLGRFKVIKVPELTDVNDWYLVDSKLIKSKGLPLWVAAKYLPSADLGLRKFDESSDYFKNTGKIKISSHVWHGNGLVYPHAIRKVTGA